MLAQVSQAEYTSPPCCITFILLREVLVPFWELLRIIATLDRDITWQVRMVLLVTLQHANVVAGLSLDSLSQVNSHNQQQ